MLTTLLLIKIYLYIEFKSILHMLLELCSRQKYYENEGRFFITALFIEIYQNLKFQAYSI